jgi:hypothetical protein
MVVYAGWQLQVLIATGSDVGSFSSPSTILVDTIQQISYDVNNKLEAKEATGERTAIAIVEGVIGITGTLERFWTSSDTHSFGFSNTMTGSAIPYYGIMICPNGYDNNGNPYIILADCKWDSQRISHRPGANLMSESLGFIARYEVTGSF